MNIKFDADGQGWQLLNSEAELLLKYPSPIYGRNMPQPYSRPERYPCLYIEIAEIDKRHSDDCAVLAFIYDFEAIIQLEADTKSAADAQ